MATEAVEIAERPSRGRRWLASTKLQLFLFAAVLIAVWEALVRIFEVPDYLVPPPTAVAVALYGGIASGLFFSHFLVTLSEALAGFAVASVAGLVVGTLVAQFRVVERLVYPFIVALQSMPKIALAPLIIVWFGYGFSSKVVVAATVAFFPVLVNVIVGLKSADPDQLDLLRSLKASRWKQLRMVQFPSALPFIFAGLNIAIVFSLLGAIVAEFVGSQAGLGNLILSFNHNLDIASVFACLIILGAMGMAMHASVQILRRRMLFWSPGENVLAP